MLKLKSLCASEFWKLPKSEIFGWFQGCSDFESYNVFGNTLDLINLLCMHVICFMFIFFLFSVLLTDYYYDVEYVTCNHGNSITVGLGGKLDI